MSNQTIGTVNVQVGQPTGPKVPSMATSRAIKNSTDLDMTDAKNDYVIAYKKSTNSFVLKPLTGVITILDAGEF